MSDGYAMRFEMSQHPWRGAVIIFDDGIAKLHYHRLDPETPVFVQVEGLKPTPEQIEMCRKLWTEMYEAMDFRVATFCPALLPYCHDIMAPTRIPA